jgi:cell division protein FtsB
MRWILLVLLVAFTALQFRLWVGQGSWAHISSLERELKDQTLVNEHLKQRNEVLENEVRGLKDGLKSVEERARTELGLIKKNETFYLLIEKDK